MAYSFRLSDESLGDGFRRIALSQLDAAIAETGDGALDPRRRVHQARKRCKKVRGLIRLVRRAFVDYAAENAALRDMARPLSGLRDQEALALSFAALAARHGREVGLRRIAPVGRALEREAGAVSDDPDFPEKAEAFGEALAGIRARAEHWRLDQPGFAPAAEGMARIYGEAREIGREFGPGASDEEFHEWRKRVKYHWQHARLLKLMHPEAIEPHAAAAGALAALLGEHHDLAVLRAHLADAPEGYARADALLVVEALIERRQAACEREIFEGAAALLAEKPGALARRWSGYWQAWRAAPLAEAA